MTNKPMAPSGPHNSIDLEGSLEAGLGSTSASSGPQSPSRRNFLAAVGATFASLNTAACIRKPMERILPFAKRPEDLLPGNPQYYATAISFGETVVGLLAKSSDGRPTKVEGNPLHPMSRGATNIWAQASVLGLYDPERSRFARIDDATVSPAQVGDQLAGLAASARASGGSGLAIVVDATPSPTMERLLSRLVTELPGTTLYAHDGAGDENAQAGARMVGVDGVTFTYGGSPSVVASFDADPMATEGDCVSFMKMFAAGRDPARGVEQANRLYAAEPNVTITGSNADHRLPWRGAQIGDLLASVAFHLRAAGVDAPQLRVPDAAKESAWAKALAEDLASRPRGTTLIVVGERQPPQVHALGLALNAALGNVGATLFPAERRRLPRKDLKALADALAAGAVRTVVVLGGNPVQDGGGDLNLASLLAKAPQSLHLGLHPDETGRAAKWHLPKSHFLEAWGDLVARDGTVSIQQPLIAPLYETLSEIEVLARLLGDEKSGYQLVRETHEASVPDGFEVAWQKWLHDGIGPKSGPVAVQPNARMLERSWAASVAEEGYELAFVRDVSVLDGRFANSPWLQEFPDPITKLTWDNAALVSPATAKRLRVENGQMLEVGHHGAKATLPAWVQPGVAEGVIVLPIGYGRPNGGKFAKSGFSVAALRLHASPWILTGAEVKTTPKRYKLASAQPEASMHDRPLARSATRADFTEDENFVEKFEVMDEKYVRTLLWEEPSPEAGHRWGMTIDLNSCTGCGACTIACQAENNIPWVGKDEVAKGREMHWIRVDRYFEPDAEKLEVKYQPIPCMQCETAPCENVCPVGATVHSPEGLNDMVYNRCIGTRYCSNNCPYKVRRFNFFHYTVRNDAEYGLGIAMQRNPDVTVRYRGVMEKCTYCVQRINRAKIDAKVRRDGKVRDGEIVTACAQVCPADAITFGDIDDETSRVAKKKADPRNYAILAELNTRPRTTFLARLTNPNPKLAGLENG